MFGPFSAKRNDISYVWQTLAICLVYDAVVLLTSECDAPSVNRARVLGVVPKNVYAGGGVGGIRERPIQSLETAPIEAQRGGRR